MKLGIAEILQQAEHLNDDAKVLFLRQHDSFALREILKYAYDKRIEWDIPDGTPPYAPCQFLDQEGMLYREIKKMYLFQKGGNPNLKPAKRETLFIQLLESIPHADAELLVAVKDHKMPYNISELTVREAFPDLLTFPMEPRTPVNVDPLPEKIETIASTRMDEKHEHLNIGLGGASVSIETILPKKVKKKDPTFAQRMKEAKARKKKEKELQNKDG